jgi:site-specific DNA-methyltransferase (cytosine-N4-specific)
MFKRVAGENLRRLRETSVDLANVGQMKRGWYRGHVTIRLGDSRELEFAGPPAAALVTSPPYGDNTSTVPYGQHAYLPLQWIDLPDIDADAGSDWVLSTYEIDRRSLGGSKRITAEQQERLTFLSPTMAKLMRRLENAKSDRRNRLVAFTRDLDDALACALPRVERGGVAAWTVGSRRVGGQLVPLHEILTELASHHGYAEIDTLHREIPVDRKRMAARNEAGATMNREHIVVLRRT